MVALLQYHYFPPYMVVYKVNPDVSPTCCPPPGIPRPVMPLSLSSVGSIPCNLSPSAEPPPTQVISPAYDGYSDGPSETPTPAPSHSPVAGLYPSASTGRSALLPSSPLSTPPPNGSTQTFMVGISCLLSLIHWFIGENVQTGLSCCLWLPVTVMAMGTP